MSWYDHYQWYSSEYDKDKPKAENGSNVGALVGVSRPSRGTTEFIQDTAYKGVLFPIAAGIDYLSGTPLRGSSQVSSTHDPQSMGDRGNGGWAMAGRGRRGYVSVRLRGNRNRLQQVKPGDSPYTGMPYGYRQGYRPYNDGGSFNTRTGTFNANRNGNNYNNRTPGRIIRSTSNNPARRVNNQGGGRSRSAPRLTRQGLNPPGMNLRMRAQPRSGNQIPGNKVRGEDVRYTKFTSRTTNLHAKTFLGTIALKDDGNISWLRGANQIGAQYYFCPLSRFYISTNNAIFGTGSGFERYRIRRGIIKLTPCSSAFSQPNWRVTALVAPSIDYFKRLTGSSFVGAPATPVATSTPTRDVLLSNPDACSTPGWEVGLTCDIKPTRWLWCASPDINSLFSYTDSTALQREAYAFVFAVNITGTLPAAGTTIDAFDVWMELDLSFRDIVPVGGLDVTFLSQYQKDYKEMYEQKCKDLEDMREMERERKYNGEPGLSDKLKDISLDDDSLVLVRSSKITAPKSKSAK